MKIDFFTPVCVTDNISESVFGIYDPQDGGPACVDYSNRGLWIAEVENRRGISLNFTAVDNCVEILREDGQMENRCDGILTGGGYLIFIELKDQRGEWIQHAVEKQLKTTIEYFKSNYDITLYKKRYAYACNRRHPRFQYSHMSMMEEFRRETDVRLCIVNKIVLK